MSEGLKFGLTIAGAFGFVWLVKKLSENDVSPKDLLFQAQSVYNGKKYGYPDCCIEAFAKMTPSYLNRHNPTHMDKLRYDASFHSGFIPCEKHAKMILEGKTTLDKLIVNRDAKLNAFPNDWTLK